MATVLSLSGTSRLRFGGIVALDGVSFDVEQGQISGLIGPNGAGKTTAFNVITRLYTPDAGTLELDGESLLRTPPHRIVAHGHRAHIPEHHLFRTMSVLENVLVGAHARGRNVGRGGRARRRSTWSGSRERARLPGGRAAVRDAEACRACARTRRASRGCCSSTSPRAA